MFEITKTVGYKRVDGSSNRWSDVGMPLVHTVAGQDARPVGVVTEEGKAITFAALFYILEGISILNILMLECVIWLSLLLIFIMQEGLVFASVS